MKDQDAFEAPETPPAPVAKPESPALAASTDLLELWDRRVPFPTFEDMLDPDIISHIRVEKATQGGYHYLHETAIEFHNGALHMGWASGREGEVNIRDEVLRGRRSTDGGWTWSEPEVWAAPPTLGSASFSHPVLAVAVGRLWGFFTCFNDEKPRTEVFTLDDATGVWQPIGARIPGFLPLCPPRKLRDGNWIMGGEDYWYEAAVAVSHGDDFTHWDLIRIPRPEPLFLKYPETALIDQGDRIVAVCRPHNQPTAPVSVSTDGGRTWDPLRYSNFPLAGSQPYGGTLSTGQHYLLTNNLEEGRALLSIAVTAPGGHLFRRIWKIRHQRFPKRRLFAGVFWKGKLVKPMVGTATEWSYPAAVEHDGRLYISYTQGKEDAALSIIPVRCLAASAD